MFSKEIKSYVLNKDIEGAHRYMRHRAHTIGNWVCVIVFVVVVAVILALPCLIIDKDDYDVATYAVTPTHKLVIDDEMLMDTQEKKELIDAAKIAVNKYYYLYFINLSAEDNKTLHEEAYEKYKSLSKKSMCIFHNEYDDSYYLWSNSDISNNTRAFELAEYDSEFKEANFVQTKDAYAHLLNGTPAEVYKKVYNHLVEFGYEDNGLCIAEKWTKDERFSALLLGYMVVLITSPLSLGIICWGMENLDDWFQYSDGLPWDIVRYNKIVNAIEEEKKEKAKNEEKERIKQHNRALAEMQNHPALIVIDKLSLLNFGGQDIADKKSTLINQLYVVDNIMSVNNDLPSDVNFYFDNFVQTISDIVIYSKTHKTDMSEPDELKMIHDSLDLFIEITSSLTRKYESRDVSNIAVNLDVLRKKASFDGLVSKDFKV